MLDPERMKVEFVGGLLACVEADAVRKYTDEPARVVERFGGSRSNWTQTKESSYVIVRVRSAQNKPEDIPKLKIWRGGWYGLPGDVSDDLLLFKVAASLRSEGVLRV